jgi:hypothetical protein
MSRSHRKPYSAPTGCASAKKDKQRAARGVRRKQNQWLRTIDDTEAAPIPHRLECAGNEVYSWGRDGKQRLQRPVKCSKYLPYQDGDPWPPRWYGKLQRK